MNTSEILDRAADLIEERGHFKGWYCGPDGSLCARGAIYAAAGNIPTERGADCNWFEGLVHNNAVIRAERLLDDAVDTYTPPWNDAPERTGAEVVAALRKAAEAARAEQ